MTSKLRHCLDLAFWYTMYVVALPFMALDWVLLKLEEPGDLLPRNWSDVDADLRTAIRWMTGYTP